ncbi:hypothetical protein C8T65DRAFT_703104 [Cerioporus squamosus]|nr:hypothetical protein C8T65DRAFT_703104 [Cerioporus squamosus]
MDTTTSSPTACNCSGPSCQPEDAPPVVVPKPRKDTNPVPRRKHISKPMRKKGVRHLEALRDTIYFSPSALRTEFLSPEVFLPDSVIKLLLDHILLLDSQDAVRDLIPTRTHLLPHIDTLWTKLQELRVLFEEMRKVNEAQKRERQKEKKSEAARKADVAGRYVIDCAHIPLADTVQGAACGGDCGEQCA